MNKLLSTMKNKGELVCDYIERFKTYL